MVLGITLITSFIIYWTERQIFLYSNFGTKVQILTYAIGLLFQRDIGGLVPCQIGSRVVAIALAMTLMIVMTTYTAVLTTRNIITTKRLPISGLNDPKFINPTTTFKIGTFEDSYHSRLFEKSPKIEWKRIGQFMKPYNFHKFSEVYERMKNGKLHAAIADQHNLLERWKNNHDCDLRIVKSILPQALSFALPKNSYWREPLSQLMRAYKSDGFLDSMKRKYMASTCQQKVSNQPNQFSILYLSGSCIMLVLGILLSAFLLLLEHVFNKCMRKSVRKYSTSSTVTYDIAA